MWQRIAVVHSALLFAVSPAMGAEKFALDPQLEYLAARSNPVAYDVDFSVVVTPPNKARKLKVWIPVPPSDMAQQVTEKAWTTFPLETRPQIAAEPKFGNQFAYFEFSEPQGAQIIRHQFKVTVYELHWKLDPGQIITTNTWPSAFDRYRASETQAVAYDDQFSGLLKQIVGERRNPLSDFERVLTWVNHNFKYDHDKASLQADAVRMLKERRGHCSDYHGFCASMGRVLGQPTRVTYGINPFPKNSPSHCKLEVFLAPYGWVSFDVSETQNFIKLIQTDEQLSASEKERLTAAAQRRLISGYRDNTWFLQTRGSDYDLVPPASRRVAVVRTAFVEADGVPLPEPDPANHAQTGLSWMTVHKYTPDREVTYPYKDVKSLAAE